MPMLIMRSVPQTETGASNGLNALFRSLGTSTAAAVVGAVLATYVVQHDGVSVPSPAAFQLSFVLGRRRGAVVAFVVALCIHAPGTRTNRARRCPSDTTAARRAPTCRHGRPAAGVIA